MGVVWQAQDERLQRMVAVKQLLLQPGLSAAETEDARRRAMREARIAARLQHPNAIAVFDVAEHNGVPCLVMEYLPSRSLAAVLAERGSLPVQEVAAIGSQVAYALAAAHRAGIVHRDIKPGNILVDDAGVAKITDFGISRAVGDATVTQTGMVAGTPAYLAPEVAKGYDPTSATDVFSLGATLYNAVEGQPPFGLNPNPLALLHAVAVGKVPPPKQAGPMTALLMSLLSTDADERPSMEEAARGLSALAGGGHHVPLMSMRVTAPARSTRTMAATATPTQATEPVSTPTVLSRFGSTRSGLPADGNRRRRHLIAAVVVVGVVLLIGGLTLAFGFNWSGSSNLTPSSSPSNAQSSAPHSSSPPSSSAPSATPGVAPGSDTPSEGQVIPWSAAGQLVINYYDGTANIQSRWNMLSPSAQGVFGDVAKFQQYWSQFPQVSANNAYGVSQNADGSANVPVDVNYGNGSTQHRVLRVILFGGKMLIDGSVVK